MSIFQSNALPRYIGKQWRLANHRLSLFLERCCMGVVSQIKDLDNSSSAVPYKWYCKQKSAPENYHGLEAYEEMTSPILDIIAKR